MKMREVFDLSTIGDGVNCNGDPNNNLKHCTPLPLIRMADKIKMAATPGYLELSAESVKRLISYQPLEEEYDVEDQPFARGKYAAVRRCRHRKSGQQFAAKFLKKCRRSTDLRPEIVHEVAILDACTATSRIVRLHQVFESQHEMVLLLELAPGGELQMLLDNDEIPEEKQVKRLMRQILDGLVYLHSINVAHLDLKPQNLVLTGEFPHCDVKLCDLGISRYISAGADIRDILGTPDYVAPEVLNYESISLATDMWSVGVLLYVLLTGCSPFGGDTKQETFCNISQCVLDFPDDLFEDITEDAIDLMKKLMVKDPCQRLNASQCLEHQWFANCDMDTFAKPNKFILPKTEEARTKSPAPIRKLDAKVTPKHKAPVETTLLESTPEILIPKTDTPTPVTPAVKSSGIKSYRWENFQRNLSEIAERAPKPDVPEPVPMPVAPRRNIESYGVIRKSKSLHTLLLDNETRLSLPHPNLNFNAGEVRRRERNREHIFAARKCIVIDDDDSSPPQSIAGSVTSSIASDQSISDSSSELSIDSSSDRSSIISLDDSLDYSKGRNVWKSEKHRTSTNDAFNNAFRRFSTNIDEFKPQVRRPARGAQTVALNKSPMPGEVNKLCKIEYRKERFGNVVVIREVKVGRFLSVNEVKCDTIQERIRRLQVQGGKKS